MYTKTQSFYLAGIMLLTGLLLGMGLHTVRREAPQVSAKDSEVGRYQIIPVGSGTIPYVYCLDTKTGRCWMASQPGSDWKLTGPLEAAAQNH